MRAKFLQEIKDETPLCVEHKMRKFAKKIISKKMKEKIKAKLDFHKRQIKEITTDKRQFQQNIESEYWVHWMESMFNNINRHESYIGKEVYQRVNNFSYTDFFEEDVLNKLGEKILYTQELHNDFLVNYKVFIIEWIEACNNNTSLFNSSSLIQNCIDLWNFEQRCEIIKFFKEL